MPAAVCALLRLSETESPAVAAVVWALVMSAALLEMSTPEEEVSAVVPETHRNTAFQKFIEICNLTKRIAIMLDCTIQCSLGDKVATSIALTFLCALNLLMKFILLASLLGDFADDDSTHLHFQLLQKLRQLLKRSHLKGNQSVSQNSFLHVLRTLLLHPIRVKAKAMCTLKHGTGSCHGPDQQKSDISMHAEG